jgi:hypothetical protein
VVREVGHVDSTGGHAGENRDAQLREPRREVAQDADLVGAARAAAGEDERELAVIRRPVRKRGEAVAGVGAHVADH